MSYADLGVNRVQIDGTDRIIAYRTLSSIENTTFGKTTITNSIHGNDNVEVVNCQFEELHLLTGQWNTLAFQNCEIAVLIVGSIQITHGIQLKDCKIHDITIQGAPKYSQLQVEGCDIQQLLHTGNTQSPIVFNGCNVSDLVLQLTTNQQARLTRAMINACDVGILRLLCDTGELQITGNSKLTSVDINTDVLTRLTIKHTEVEGDFSCRVDQDTIVFDSEKLVVKGNLFLYALNAWFLGKGLSVAKDLLIHRRQDSHSIDLSASKIGKLMSSSLAPYNHKRLQITDSSLETLILDDASSNIFLKNVNVLSKLSFENTTLSDQALFDRVYLDKCVLSFSNSSITEARFHSIRWRHDYAIDETTRDGDLESKLAQYWDVREAYRQLKVVSLSFENKIDAKQFLKHELRVYFKAVKTTLWNLTSQWLSEILNQTNRWKSFKKTTADWFRYFGDFLVLGSNSLFSDFGESWLRPFLWLFALHTLMFWSLTNDPSVSLGVEFGLDNPTFDAFWRGLGTYLNLLNPVHDSEVANVYNKEIKSSLYGVRDFFMRLSTAYFIYYFVRATRKFNFNI